MKKIHVLIILLLLLFAQLSYAQNHGQAAIDSMLKELGSGKYRDKEDTNKVMLLIYISWAYNEILKPDEGIKYAQKALELALKLNFKTGIGPVYNVFGSAYTHKGDYNNAVAYYNRAISITTELGDKNGIAMVTGNRAGVYCDMGDYKAALKDDLKALEISEQMDNKSSMLHAFINIGNIYFDQGGYPKALEYYFNSLKVSEKLGRKASIADAYLSIANVYIKEQDAADALENYNKALIIYQEVQNSIGVVTAYVDIGDVYQFQDSLIQSLEYYQKALKILNLSDDKRIRIALANSMGNTYYMQHKYTNAIEYYQASSKLANEIGAKQSIADNFNSLGNCFLDIVENEAADSSAREKNVTDVKIYHSLPTVIIPVSKAKLLHTAFDYYQKALIIEQKMNVQALMESTYTGLAKACKLSRDYKRALLYSEKAAAIKDSLFSKENNEKIVRLEMKNDYDHQHLVDSLKQSQDIQAGKFKLQKQKIVLYISLSIFLVLIITITVVQRTQLKRTKKQQQELFSRQLLEIELKALRAQMNPHFIFNSLNSIQAFILKENKIEATMYLQKFSNLMRMILNNSQKTSNTIEEETEILSLYMDLERLRLKNSFDFEIKIGEGIDPTFAEIPSMVLQPLVENSIWHGFIRSPNKGLLTVEFIKSKNKLTCIVMDNGIGINSSKDHRSHESKGLKLIEDRLQAWSKMKGLKYELKVTADIGVGTKTEITILYTAYA